MRGRMGDRKTGENKEGWGEGGMGGLLLDVADV